jgi:excinuclease ABC subunit A
MSKSIRIVGARQHNLKNLTLEIPRDQLVVVTGVSGSGKTSLAFDTLYAEGQRRYVESLSAQAQMSIERMEKPDVDFIDGLSPAIAIEQLSSQANPRSTVATATEIYDYLRVLYATCGQPHDPATGEPVMRHTTVSIVEKVIGYGEGSRLMICAPLAASELVTPLKLWEKLGRQGFVRVRIDGEVRELEEKPKVTEKSQVELVIDRVVIKADVHSRLMDSIGIALRRSGHASTMLILRLTEAGCAEESILT